MNEYEFLGLGYHNPLSIDSYTGATNSETLDLKQAPSSTGNQLWILSISLEPIPFNTTARSNVVQHQFKHHGDNTSFEIPCPQDSGYLPTGAAATLTVATAAVAGAESIALSTGTAYEAMPVGQYIRFSNHTKVYRVTSKSNGTVGLYPALQNAVTTGTADLAPNIKVKYNQNIALSVAYGNRGEYYPRLDVIEYYESP